MDSHDRDYQKQFFMKYIRDSKHNIQPCVTENCTLADEIHPLEDKFIYEKNMNSNVTESSYLQLDNYYKKTNARAANSEVVFNQPFKGKKNTRIRSKKVTKYINNCAYKDSDERPDIQAYRNISYFKMSCKKKTTASNESKKTAKPKTKKTSSQLVNEIIKNVAPIAAIYEDKLFPSGKIYDSKIQKSKQDLLPESQRTYILKTKALLQPLENKLSVKYIISNSNNATKSYANQLWTNNDFNFLNAKENKITAVKHKAKFVIHRAENKFICKNNRGRNDFNLLNVKENKIEAVKLKAKLIIHPTEGKFSCKENRDADDFNLLKVRENKEATVKPMVKLAIHPLEGKFMNKEKKGGIIGEEIEENSIGEQYFEYECRKVNKIKKNKRAKCHTACKKKTKKTNHPLEDKFINDDSKCTENDKDVIKYIIFQLKNGKKYQIVHRLKRDIPIKLHQTIKPKGKNAIHPLENKSFYEVNASTKISDDTCKNSYFQCYPESEIKTLNDIKSDTAIKTYRAVKPKAKSCVHPLGKKFMCRKNTHIHHVNNDMLTQTYPITECQSLPLFCEICDIKVNGYEPLLDHFVSFKHNKNVQNPKLKDHIDFEEYDRRLTLLKKKISSRQENIYDCDFCSAFFRNSKQYNLHKKIGKHFDNVRKSYQIVFPQAKEKIRSSRGI